MAGEAGEFDIIRLGAQGDGIADAPDGPRFVPFALPGERVRVTGGDMAEVVADASPERRGDLPPFQDAAAALPTRMSEDSMPEWKGGIVVEAFRQRGLSPDIARCCGCRRARAAAPC